MEHVEGSSGSLFPRPFNDYRAPQVRGSGPIVALGKVGLRCTSRQKGALGDKQAKRQESLEAVKNNSVRYSEKAVSCSKPAITCHNEFSRTSPARVYRANRIRSSDSSLS